LLSPGWLGKGRIELALRQKGTREEQEIRGLPSTEGAAIPNQPNFPKLYLFSTG
jgi:hypothetical protein